MPTEKERRWAAVEAEMAAYQAVYDNFRYTDAQRERVIDFIGAAMKVIRGDAKFESLERLIPMAQTVPTPYGGEVTKKNSSEFAYDARFLNDWTSIYMVGAPDAQGQIEPYHFQIHFRPEMTIQRERLEQLLQLKVGPGWIPDGGNLQTPEVMLHSGRVRQPATFEYGIQNPPPCAPYAVQVKFTYLNGPDKDPLTATTLAHLEIRRDYLRPEEIQERDNKRFGHLPQTSERCTKSGKYIPHFADDELTHQARLENQAVSYPKGGVFSTVHLWNPRLQHHERVSAWWEWVAPDPFEEEIERMFGKRKG